MDRRVVVGQGVASGIRKGVREALVTRLLYGAGFEG